MSAALDPAVTLSFLDTKGIRPASAVEDALAPGGGVTNPGEAALVMQLLSGLLAAGVPAADIGIISPYKAQVRVWVAKKTHRLAARLGYMHALINLQLVLISHS